MSAPTIASAWAAAAGGIAAVMTTTAAVTKATSKAAYVDAAWGASFVAAACAAAGYTVSTGRSLDWRAWLLIGVVTIWGARLTWHLGSRVRGSDHDDPRYEDLLGGSIRDVPFLRVVVKVFVLQAVLVTLVTLPVVVGIVRPMAEVWPVYLGVALWAVGLWFEAVSDAQLAAFRADPHRPRLLTTGLWAWTRHPNYFGDFCVWWGFWLIGGAASGLADGAGTLLSPLVMSWILIGISGVRLAEKRMQGRPGWTAYRARTPIFFPVPPVRKNPSKKGVRAE